MVRVITQEEREELKNVLMDECNIKIEFVTFTVEEFEDFEQLAQGKN